jgi:hypothetical protein
VTWARNREPSLRLRTNSPSHVRGLVGADGEVPDVAAQGLLARPAVESLGVLVPVRHPTAQVGGYDGGLDLLDQVRLEQHLFLNFFTIGYVEQHALAEQEWARSVPDDHRLVARPHDPPGPGRQTVLELERSALLARTCSERTRSRSCGCRSFAKSSGSASHSSGAAPSISSACGLTYIVEDTSSSAAT